MHEETIFKRKNPSLILTKQENTACARRHDPEFERQMKIGREYMARYTKLLEKLAK